MLMLTVESVQLKIPWTKLTSGGLQISADNICLVFQLHRKLFDDVFDPNDSDAPLSDKMVRLPRTISHYNSFF